MPDSPLAPPLDPRIEERAGDHLAVYLAINTLVVFAISFTAFLTLADNHIYYYRDPHTLVDKGPLDPVLTLFAAAIFAVLSTAAVTIPTLLAYRLWYKRSTRAITSHP